jgi:hypothetical protein
LSQLGSYLGDTESPDGEILAFRMGDSAVIVELTVGMPYREPGTIFDALDRRTGRHVWPERKTYPSTLVEAMSATSVMN